MDDLLLFMPSKKAHLAKLEDLGKALLKNGLKISPKKYQSFRTQLQYMGNRIFIPDRRVTKLLKPIYDLMRKGIQFIWEEEQQIVFEEIKCRLVKPPV